MAKIQNLTMVYQEPLHIRDIGEYSITPTTLLERRFTGPVTLSPGLASAAAASALATAPATIASHNKDDFFIEQYRYTPTPGSAVGPEISRFGINPYAQITQNNVTTAAAVAAPSGGNKSKTDPRSSVISEWDDKAVKYLTDIERFVFAKAREHLDVNPDTVAVVIDIFARNPDKSIKSEAKADVSTGALPSAIVTVPETHSVVLYKQKDAFGASNYLVIDPSNNKFSYVLLGIPEAVVCVTPTDSIQIYKASGPTGPTSWRDCVDIAVKLGFALTEHKDRFPLSYVDCGGGVRRLVIDHRFAESSTSIKYITNQPSTYKFMPKFAADYTFRAHQSSHIPESGMMYFLMQQFQRTLESVSQNCIQSGRDFSKVRDAVIRKYDPTKIVSTSHQDFVNAFGIMCSDLSALEIKTRDIGFLEAQERALIRYDATAVIDALLT